MACFYARKFFSLVLLSIGPESVSSEDIFSNETMVLFIHDLWVLVNTVACIVKS